METSSWVILLGVAIVLALGAGLIWGVTFMVNDTDEWVREANAEKERLTEENERLSARLETYRTDAAREFDVP